MFGDPVFYSSIPKEELASWNDSDLSGAIWEEAVHLTGGYGFKATDVAKLPLGFRAVLAEGSIRAHVEGDGLSCAIWNEDGVDMFALAKDCHAAVGNRELDELLTRVIELVRTWQQDGDRTPRSMQAEDFTSSKIGQELESLSDQLCELAEGGFVAMMAFLRQRPQLFHSVPTN